jgi:predicted ATPase/DNA-binding SARP family transcriptional activator
MEFRVLGPLEVRHHGRALALGGAQQQALLAILLTQVNQVVASDRLADLLWGEAAPATADHMLVVYVFNLRRVLEPGGAPYRLLVRRGPGYVLEIATHQLDSAKFEDLVESAKELPPEQKASELAKALGLWRGPAYADFSSQGFAVGEAARLEELRLHALEERIDADLTLGRHHELIGELESLVGEHPLRERLSGQLMLALYRSGRQAEASAVYQRTRHRLVDELGMEPGPELQSRLTRILKQDPELDLLQREQVELRSNLPVQLTSFVGREREVQEVGGLVREFRIVTLVGAGGSGKTRLAIEIGANSLESFAGGVWFVDLSAVSEGDFVFQAIARTFELKEQPGRSLLGIIADHLQRKSILLILDNCEQVVDSAAWTSEALLTRCPDLHVLATSRQRLGLDGEHVRQVAPLAVPMNDSAAEVARCEAVQLFVDRARLSLASFAVTEQNAPSVAELCRQLDGLPLAIELAAARMGALSPDEILPRLADQFGILTAGSRTRPPRHRSLGATLDWSYRLLEAEEAAVFRRLSVFSGGFHLNAAETVTSDAGVKPAAIAALLVRLCDKSLVAAEERSPNTIRYRLLEAVRAFAAERLEEFGERDAVRRRHATFYLELVEGAQAGIAGADAQIWLDKMEIEHDNARSALRWAVAEDRDLALQLAVALAPFWLLRLHLNEGRHWLSTVLEGEAGRREWSQIPERGYQVAEALAAEAEFTDRHGEHELAQTYVEEALQIGQMLQDKGIAASLMALVGGFAARRGEIAQAQSNFEQALAVLDQVGPTFKVPGFASVSALRAGIDISLATALASLGDYTGAHSHYLKAVPYVERTGGRSLVSVSIGLGEYALVNRDLPAAREHFGNALEVAVRLRDQTGMAVTLNYCAGLAAASAKPVPAMHLQGASLRIREGLSIPPEWIGHHPSERSVKPLLESAYRELGARKADAQIEAGRAMSNEQAIECALKEVLS